MKTLKLLCFFLLFLATTMVTAQQARLNVSALFDPSYGSIFDPNITYSIPATFANFNTAKATNQQFIYVTVNTNQIDFSKTPLLAPNNQFPTIYNTNKEPFIQLGDYDTEFLNKRDNNRAFYEATRNTIISSGYTNGAVIGPRW